MNFKKISCTLGVYILAGLFIVNPMTTLKEFNTTTINAIEYTYNPDIDQNCIFECDTNDSNSTCVITHYNGTDTNVTIPSKITICKYDDDYAEYISTTYTVVGISGFKNDNSNNSNKITQITIPNTVKDISKNAFKNYTNLSSVIFEENSCLENIGIEAFSNTNLSEITILSSNLKTIGNNAFGYTNTGTKTNFKINCSTSNQNVIYDYIKNTDFSMNVTNGTSVSLSLDGNIGVNFYINIGEKILSDTNSTMILSTDNNQTIEIPRNQWILDSSTNMYKFTVYVTAR